MGMEIWEWKYGGENVGMDKTCYDTHLCNCIAGGCCDNM